MKTLLFLLIASNLFSQNLIPFQQNSLWGYKNEKDEVVIKPQYQLAKRFYQNHAIVYKNDSAGLIDKKNQVILPFSFNYLQPLSNNTYMYGYQSKYFGEFDSGIINLKGERLTPPLYYNINLIDNNYFVTTKKDIEITEGPLAGMHESHTKYGVIDSNGKIIIPVNYDSAKSVDKDRIVMGKKNVEILFDNLGKQLTTENFSSINLFYDDLASSRIENRCGYINKNGKVEIPFAYSACYPFYKNKAVISQNFKFIIIDKKAKPLTSELSYEDLKKYLEENKLEIMMDEFRFMNRKNQEKFIE